METAILIREWLISVAILFLLVRYAWFGEREIRALKAERDQAQGVGSPKLAKEWLTVSKALDEMAGQKQILQQDFAKLIAKGQAETEQQRLLGVAIGIMEGAAGLDLLVGDHLEHSQTATGPFDFIGTIQKLRDNLLKQSQEAVEGRRPAFTNLNRISAQKPPAR